MTWTVPVVTETTLPHTIGPGWADDPEQRRAEIQAQERLVSSICDLLDEYPLIEEGIV